MDATDPIKETTPAALKALRAAGVRIVMLTGDSKTTAETAGKELRPRQAAISGEVD